MEDGEDYADPKSKTALAEEAVHMAEEFIP